MSRSKTKAVPVRWSDEQFQRFAETVPDATVYVDEHGKILLVNTQLEELFDYRREQLVGQSISMLIPQRFHGRISIPGSPGWDDSRRSWQRRGMGISGVRRGGAEFPAEISVRPIETSRGPIYVAAIRDMTHQVEARESLLQHLSDLAHVSRLSTTGELVAGLAHELNQPLYAIANYARACQELARGPGDSAARLVEMSDKLMEQADRAAEIVRRLRRFVSRREPRRVPVDINALVREVQQMMLFHSHRFAITLRLDLQEELPAISGDAILLEQVLVNLVRNAFEAMSDAQSPDPQVIVTTAYHGAGLIDVTVTDNGPGFRTENLEQLFESYYTTKEQGMGLGLVISRSIAEAHGGRLTADAPRDGGAEFHLSLPTVQEPARVS